MNRLPESDVPAIGAQSTALKRTFGFSCLILILLQVWRPFYFLADDNLAYWFPIVNGVGVRLAHAQSPFLDPNLFSGYDLLRDPTAISLWNPLVLGLSLLANTRFYLAIADLFASVNLVVSALAFALLLCHLRELKGLELSDGRIAFLSLSFAFSAYAINIGACWLMFLANQAALPMIFLGLFAARQGAGIRWVAGGVLYALLVGHLSPFLYTLFFLSLFVAGLCWAERSWIPLGRWCGGLALAFLLASPVLLPAAQGFASSPRNTPLGLGTTSQSSVPFLALISAYFGGYIGILMGNSLGLFSRHFILGLASCLANYQFFVSWRKRPAFSRLEISIGALALLIALFMARPNWLGALISHVPLYRSLRWPFRELFIFLFLAHLWIALRPVSVSMRAYQLLSGLGIAIFFISMAVVPPWNFSPMEVDRGLLLSGQARAYWQHVKPLIGPGNRIIAVVAPSITSKHEREIPFSLIGALNYPALFDVPSLSGYTAQGFAKPKMAEDVPYFFGGIYSPQAGDRVLKANRHVKSLHLVSLHPLRIDLCSAQGCQTLPVPSVAPANGP